jgi:hypothetical protein
VVGKLFTAFVVYTTRLSVVYAGFAIIVAALLWTYFGWLILLIGAQLSFYVQNRNYLRLGLTELRLSAVQREQLTLRVMYLIARSYHDGKNRWTVDGLSHELACPASPCRASSMRSKPRAWSRSPTTRYCCRHVTWARSPSRKSSTSARNEKAGQVAPRPFKVPAVDAISSKMDEAWRRSCGDTTLRELVEQK